MLILYLAVCDISDLIRFNVWRNLAVVIKECQIWRQNNWLFSLSCTVSVCSFVLVPPQWVCTWEREHFQTFQKSRRSPSRPQIQFHLLQRWRWNTHTHTDTFSCSYKHLRCSGIAKQHYYPCWATCMLVQDLRLLLLIFECTLSASNLLSLRLSLPLSNPFLM